MHCRLQTLYICSFFRGIPTYYFQWCMPDYVQFLCTTSNSLTPSLSSLQHYRGIKFLCSKRVHRLCCLNAKMQLAIRRQFVSKKVPSCMEILAYTYIISYVCSVAWYVVKALLKVVISQIRISELKKQVGVIKSSSSQVIIISFRYNIFVFAKNNNAKKSYLSYIYNVSLSFFLPRL